MPLSSPLAKTALHSSAEGHELPAKPSRGWDEKSGMAYQLLKRPRYTLPTLLASLWSCFGIILLGFCPLYLPAIPQVFQSLWQEGFQTSLASQPQVIYSFQFVALVGFSAFFGGNLATLLVVLMLIAGFVFRVPLFSYGSGWDYLLFPTAGYLLGYFFVANLAAWSYKRLLGKPRNELQHITLPMGMALLLVVVHHLFGSLYLGALTLCGVLGWEEAAHWMRCLSLAPLMYDWLFASLALYLVRPLRFLFWPILY